MTDTALLSADGSDRAEIEALEGVLRDLGFAVVHVPRAHSPEQAMEKAAEDAGTDPVSLCLLDLRNNGEAMRLARLVRTQHPHAVVIGLADPARPSAAAEAIRAGVFDIASRPASAADLQALISNAREQVALAAAPPRLPDMSSHGVTGTSAAIRAVLDLVQRAAQAQCGIVICGERGSGRETIARAVHAHGPHDRPFVAVDCGGPSPEDIELQLFGVVTKRATPGSLERRSLERVGKNSQIHAAAGGILFLENVTEMPARVQARLVRVLRDREAFFGDSRDPVATDIRPVGSADTSFDAAVEEGRLRPDLSERLSLIRIDVPALRQRREDIPLLATQFLKELCRANNRPAKTLTRPALTVLSALPWRGNIPELRAFLERLVLLVPNGLVRLEDVLAHTQLEGSSISPTGLDATLRQARARFERDYIAAVLQHHHGRIADAARVLGVQRTNLYRKMRRLSLSRSKG